MKNRLYSIAAAAVLAILFYSNINANGVGVVDAKTGQYLRLVSSTVNVSVENQAAVVTAVQTFRNTNSSTKIIKYAFPIPEGGSATQLEYKINGIWYTTKFTNSKQDTTSSGTGTGTAQPAFLNYIGKTPLYFPITDSLKADSLLTVRLTYVQLLKYDFGKVKFSYPNNYSLIQSVPLETQDLTFTVVSQRSIAGIQLLSHPAQSNTNTGHEARVNVKLSSAAADKDYSVEYELSRQELGLFGISSFFPEQAVPDSLGRGFFLFMVEPDAGQTTKIIKKRMNLVIDRSGSMGGTSITQALNASKSIVNNLNEGDMFNIIDFDNIVSSFKPELVPFNDKNKNEAIEYITSLNARGSTNISGALELAISQFPKATDTTANMIIFLTDGQPNVGIYTTDGILSLVNTKLKDVDTTLSIFSFGIGTGVSNQLLSLLASQHNGTCEFIDGSQLEEVLTRFYSVIRNPVVIKPSVMFDPAVSAEVFPKPLSNLYAGQQLLISGRYKNAQSVNVTISGQAFGNPVSYTYTINLSDSMQTKNHFLSKIWAKMKIENLLVSYYNVSPSSSAGMRYKEEIIIYSMLYGVSSPFTSMTGGGSTGIFEEAGGRLAEKKNTPADFELIGNYPNPFNPGTYISFRTASSIEQTAYVRIYNALGKLIREYTVNVGQPGSYRIYWDGMDSHNQMASAGNYIYTVSMGSTVLAGKMCLLK